MQYSVVKISWVTNMFSNVQLIIQTEQKSGGYSCECFDGIPVIRPICIVITTVGSFSAKINANELRDALLQTISTNCPQAVRIHSPCGGHSPSPAVCHAYDNSSYRRLLVIIGDISTTYPGNPSHPANLAQWVSGDSDSPVLPIFPRGAPVSTLAPAHIRTINAAFYDNSIIELTPVVLAVAGLTTEDFRIFISYRRQDNQAIADQLFDALSHEGFDVFLDRFRVPPSIDFQQHLFQELANKSMVLVLESQTIMNSQWVVDEINFAKTQRLGLFALQLPCGQNVPGIDSDARMTMTGSDLTTDRLTAQALRQVVQRVKEEHGRALLRRREALRYSMTAALEMQGFSDVTFDPRGLLHLQSSAGVDYAVWLTTRPPDVPDFHWVGRHKTDVDTGIVIGPSAHYLPSRREQFDWLSSVSGIYYYDEGTILSVAKQIAGGSL